MKCIAIFLVLVYHSTICFFDFINEPSVLSYFRYYLRTLLSPCVSLFFFVNGYLLFKKELDLKKHIIKTIRLVILAIIWSFIKVLVLMLIKKEYLSFNEILLIIWNLQGGWVNSLWFLGALVCIYIIFPILKLAYDIKPKYFNYFIITAAIFTFGNVILNELGTILNKSMPLQGVNCFSMFNPFRGIYGYTFVYFCLGGYIYKIEKDIKLIRPLKRNIISIIVMLIFCLGLFCVGLLYSYINNTIWDIVWNGYDTIFTLGNVLCMYVLSLNYKKDYKLVKIISSNTLGIYFIHGFFVEATIYRLQEYKFLCNIPYNIIYALLILFASLGITLILKKIPVIKRLF